jgi:hypothetical protein
MAGTVIKTSTMTSGSSTALPALTGTQSVTQWLQPLLPLHAKNVNARAYVAGYPVGTQSGTFRQTKEISLPFTSTAPGWVLVRGVAVLYADSLNNWRMKFNIEATMTAIASMVGITCTGITYKTTTNYYQAVTVMCIGTSPYSGSGQTSYTNPRIEVFPATSTTTMHVSGDVELDAEPTTYTTQANMEGGNVAVTSSYIGSIYSPTQNRIYLIPFGAATATQWQYVDCSNGSVVNYTHGMSLAGACGYVGGTYSPTLNRIYFSPFYYATATQWHYIDCNSGSAVAYSHGATVVYMGYSGNGVFSPTQNRIYFSLNQQSAQSIWHYIDCSNGSVVAYTHGATISSGVSAYGGWCYSPTQNRIYMPPNTQSTVSIWHYVDCSNGSVVAYTHGATVSGTYAGSTYSPTQNRIYFIPYAPGTSGIWHYVDCSNGSVVAYTHGATIVSTLAYNTGVYHPALNRIYFTPRQQCTAPIWHYIDCSNGSVVAYTHGATVIDAGGGAYSSGVYSPTQNRIYMSPRDQSTVSTWHYIGTTGDATGLMPHMFGSTILS